MATRHGYPIAEVLVKKHGWSFDLTMGDDYFGDIPLIDPVTGESVDPYTALDRQHERCGGESATDSPLREIDPLKWSALRACEFSETVPYCAFEGEPPNAATCAEAFLHLSRLTQFVRREVLK